MTITDIALSPAIVAANTTAEQTFTCRDVEAEAILVSVSKPTAQAGLGIVGWRVVSHQVIGITFSNNTISGITPTAGEKYTLTFIPSGKGSKRNV